METESETEIVTPCLHQTRLLLHRIALQQLKALYTERDKPGLLQGVTK